MNRVIILVYMAGLLLMTCSRKDNSLTVQNETSLDQMCRPFVFELESLHQKYGTPKAGKLIPIDEHEQVVPFQYDDINGDGFADELFFQMDIKANSQKKVYFKSSAENYQFEAATNVFLGKIEGDSVKSLERAERLDTWDNRITAGTFRAEGICWENDKVGFRNYFDMRNGMDIFGKTTSEMIMDKVGSPALGNYHELSDWGMDILKVGQSLGAGALALYYKDSLIRLTSTDATFKTGYNGPLRSAFSLNFYSVDLGDKQIDVAQTIEIQKGKYYYTSKVSLSDTSGIQLVAGIVNLHDTDMKMLDVSNNTVLYTFGRQSENKDLLGMAIQVPNDIFIKAVDTNDISNEIPDTYAAVISPDNATYRFYACWEKSEPVYFGSEDSFINFR